MVGESLTSLRVSNCSQSDEPVGRIPIVEHLYSPRANLNDGNEDHHRFPDDMLTRPPGNPHTPSSAVSTAHNSAVRPLSPSSRHRLSAVTVGGWVGMPRTLSTIQYQNHHGLMIQGWKQEEELTSEDTKDRRDRSSDEHKDHPQRENLHA